jgi:hypothetical protein
MLSLFVLYVVTIIGDNCRFRKGSTSSGGRRVRDNVERGRQSTMRGSEIAASLGGGRCTIWGGVEGEAGTLC